jgi:hypothetical protein
MSATCGVEGRGRRYKVVILPTFCVQLLVFTVQSPTHCQVSPPHCPLSSLSLSLFSLSCSLSHLSRPPTSLSCSQSSLSCLGYIILSTACCPASSAQCIDMTCRRKTSCSLYNMSGLLYNSLFCSQQVQISNLIIYSDFTVYK